MKNSGRGYRLQWSVLSTLPCYIVHRAEYQWCGNNDNQQYKKFCVLRGGIKTWNYFYALEIEYHDFFLNDRFLNLYEYIMHFWSSITSCTAKSFFRNIQSLHLIFQYSLSRRKTALYKCVLITWDWARL